MGHSYASERKLPHRDETRHAQPETRPHRSRKDTKRWCRGKPGVEHRPERVRRAWLGKFVTCRWLPFYVLGEPRWNRARWICGHVDRCAECGKTLRHYVGRECPDWRPCEGEA